MELKNDWKVIMTQAWSVRFIILAAIFSSAPVFISLVSAEMLGVSPLVFASLASLSSVLAFLSRFIAQPGMYQK